jgi:soluble lytic murein transglycosylase-like protein
LTVPRTASAKK